MQRGKKGKRHIGLWTLIQRHSPWTYVGRPCEPDARHHLDRQLGLLALPHTRVPLEQGRTHEALRVVHALLAWPATAHNLGTGGKCSRMVLAAQGKKRK